MLKVFPNIFSIYIACAVSKRPRGVRNSNLREILKKPYHLNEGPMNSGLKIKPQMFGPTDQNFIIKTKPKKEGITQRIPGNFTPTSVN